METVYCNGLSLSALLVKVYPKGKLFFLQDRLLLTDFNNNQVDSFDVIDFVNQAF